MKDAADMENIRNQNINDQAASDVWRGTKPTNMVQITGDWGANTYSDDADKMHSDTMASARKINGVAKGGVDSQEKSDEWRGKANPFGKLQSIIISAVQLH